MRYLEMLTVRRKETPLPTVPSPVEKPTLQEFRPFTDDEIEKLTKDGAIILTLTGQTIKDQETAGRLFWYITEGGHGLLKLPSMETQVAIYPDPKRFFIPNSGNKDLPTQEKLAERDGQELRERLGLRDDSLTVIIPDQASTLTELTFKYLDKTTETGKGVWLFGKDYGYLYGRTKNPVDEPVNEFGSFVAHVGLANPAYGLFVYYFPRGDGLVALRVVRLVVAKKK